MSPAAIAPAARTELAPCRICKTTAAEHGRSQPDLCGRIDCIEAAASRARRRDRALAHARPLTHEQLVARLAADRGRDDQVDGREPEDDEDLTTHELERGDVVALG